MSLPTVTVVSPSTGPTAGRTLVEITGTGFRLATAQTARPAPVPPPPVSVQFVQVVVRKGVSTTVTRDGTNVQVESATKLTCWTPVGDHAEANADLVASVIVTNLDDAGDPIPGETVTKTSAFTYSLPKLTAESDFGRVIRALIRECKRQLCEETVFTTETDWDDDATDGLNTTAAPKLPSLTLIGPRPSRDPERMTTQPRKALVAGVWKRYRAAPVLDLEFDLVGATDNEGTLLNFLVQSVEFFRRNPYLVVDANGSDPTAGTVEFELELLTDPTADSAANLSNVHSFRGSFVVKGVPVEGFAGVTDDLQFGRAPLIETFEIESARTEAA